MQEKEDFIYMCVQGLHDQSPLSLQRRMSGYTREGWVGARGLDAAAGKRMLDETG